MSYRNMLREINTLLADRKKATEYPDLHDWTMEAYSVIDRLSHLPKGSYEIRNPLDRRCALEMQKKMPVLEKEIQKTINILKKMERGN